MRTTVAGSSSAAATAATAALSLGIGVEKPAVVLQIGSRYTRCGFSGEHIPRCVVPSTVQRLGRTVHVMAPALWADGAQLREVLIDFLFEVLYRKLLVKAHERRIVVVEDLLTPQPFREALAHVLLLHYLGTSIAFIPTFEAVLYPLTLPTVLLVDVGYAESSVMAVHEFHAVRRSFSSDGKGASAVHGRIRQVVQAAHATLHLTDAQVEDIAVRACFAAPPPAGVTVAKAHYPLPQGKSLALDAAVRVNAPNLLFEDDEHGNSLQRLVLEALNRCPMDARKSLAQNIVLTGGGSQLPGFEYRLLQELRGLCDAPEFTKLKGTLVTRYVTTAQLEADSATSLDQVEFGEASSKISMDLLAVVPETAIVDYCHVTKGEGTKVSVEIQTFEAWNTKPVKDIQLTGKKSFKVTSVEQRKNEAASGVASSFAIHDPPFPPNVLAWVGGAIFAALEGLAERSVSQESFRQSQKLPDWAAIDSGRYAADDDENSAAKTDAEAEEPVKAAAVGVSVA